MLSSRGPMAVQRSPRPEEIAVLRLLAGGPRIVSAGPIGRCVREGWCRVIVDETSEGPRRRTIVIFDLTETGRDLIGMT